MNTTYSELLQRRRQHLNITLDKNSRAVWIEFKYSTERPCCSPALLQDLQAVQHTIRQTAQTGYHQNQPDRLMFQVLASSDTRAFNLGGDLNYFIELIEAGDRENLLGYAKTCIDIQFSSVTHYDIPYTTNSLVQREAVGGGFEAALSNNVLEAEESARFGFPEITFGRYPGMGAISL